MLALAVLAAGGSVRAQGLESVRPGVRLRLTLKDNATPLIGTLEAYHPDTVWIHQAEGGTMGIPFARLERVQVSRGRRGHAGTGALVGFLVGAAIGVPSGLGCDCADPAAAAAVFTLILGGLGAGAGAGVGAAMKSEAWQPLEFPPTVAGSMAGQPSAVLRLRVFP